LSSSPVLIWGRILISFDDGYITWINDGKVMWTIQGAGMGPDSATEIGARPIPQEPMVNLKLFPHKIMRDGISLNLLHPPVYHSQPRVLTELWGH
jgi:hypothetical protein